MISTSSALVRNGMSWFLRSANGQNLAYGTLNSWEGFASKFGNLGTHLSTLATRFKGVGGRNVIFPKIKFCHFYKKRRASLTKIVSVLITKIYACLFFGINNFRLIKRKKTKNKNVDRA